MVLVNLELDPYWNQFSLLIHIYDPAIDNNLKGDNKQ